jgi:hypothetical protein
MTSLLAAHRPTEWNFPLFLHVLGAMILVGGVLTSASLLAYARGEVRYLRLGYWTLLVVALPGFILMRAGAEWIASKEGYTEKGAPSPTWLGIGFLVADIGALLLLLALILGGVGVRRLRSGKGAGLLKGTLGISLVLLAAYVVAIWAMAGKPG